MLLAPDRRPIGYSFIWSWALLCIPTIVIAVRVSSTRHTLTEDALTTRTGIATRRTDVVELYRVRDVRAVSSALAGGRVVITMADGAERVARYVRDADGVVDQIRSRVAAARVSRGTSYREQI